MQLRTLFVGIVLGAGAALITSQAISQDGTLHDDQQREMQDSGADGAMQQPSPEQMQEAMQAWLQLIQPGEMHELLEQFVGEWTTRTEMFLAGPGGDATVTEGKSTRTMVLGGRFILQEESSTMPMPDPATGELRNIPWNGMGLFGYDNIRNLYVGCWADSMGTQILMMKGAADPTGKVFTYYGEMDEPMLGIIGRTVKYVTTIVDENTQTFEIYDLHAADDYLVFRVTYTREQSED